MTTAKLGLLLLLLLMGSLNVHAKKYLAVEGVVLCKNCKYLGMDDLTDNTPLLGAVVRLECNTKYGNVNVTGTTGPTGYFFITPSTIQSNAYEKCRVFLVSSPSLTCNLPTNIFLGIYPGATLTFVKTLKPPPGSNKYARTFDLFKVGPLAYQYKSPC